MRDDEQVYPIEKPTDVEDVTRLSALQVRYLVLGADPESLFGAAQDYLHTAERLEATADGIRQGASDLADTWRSPAADRSQQQLRQYYASARSLATACRFTAAAMTHAAAALRAAQTRLHFMPATPLPSPDPTSLESIAHQKILADLNSAYHDAITLAPNQLAICLPAEAFDSQREILGDTWEDLRGDTPSSTATPHAAVGYSATPRPSILPPVIPPNPPGGRNATGSSGGMGDWLQERNVPAQRVSRFDERRENDPSSPPGLPYEPGSFLASVGLPGSIIDVSNGSLPSARVVIDPSDRIAPGSVNESRSNPTGTAVGGGSSTGQGGGVIPSSGQSEREGERQRRYYLKEERDVWGVQDAPPAVLYGEFKPPRTEIDDDDDDDF